MSKTTIETTITPSYLRNRTKEQLIDLVLAGLNENDRLQTRITDLETALQGIEFATRPDSGSFWKLRGWLDDRNIYNADVSAEHVINLVARSLITPLTEAGK